MIIEKPYLNRILAVIVLYNESLESSITFQSLTESLKTNTRDGSKFRLVIYDNSPNPLKAVFNQYPLFSITYKSDISNAGLSRAYNYASTIAEIEAFEYILLLDQDTFLPKNILSLYSDAIEKYQYLNLFAPILKISNGIFLSPARFFLHRGFKTKIIPGVYPLSKYAPINSGMLIKLSSFIEAGGYNDKVRLDFSDFQFIECFRKRNKEFYVIDAICIQQFSNVVNNFTQIKTRFEFYCEGAKYAYKASLLDNFTYFMIVFMRCLALSIRTRKLIFFKTFYNKYISG